MEDQWEPLPLTQKVDAFVERIREPVVAIFAAWTIGIVIGITLAAIF
jgi:hypothetical protein